MLIGWMNPLVGFQEARTPLKDCMNTYVNSLRKEEITAMRFSMLPQERI